MSNRVALISGANKGIGKEVARQLGKAGMTVLVGSRDKNNGQKAVDELRAEGIIAETIELDVSDSKSIEKAAKSIAEKHDKIDVLVNNAGVFLDRKVGLEAEVELIEKTFETNFLGAVKLTKALSPLLKKSDRARIVNVSSSLGSLHINGDPKSPMAGSGFIGYNCSKAALNMFTVITADSFKDSAVKVNSACPGYVATDINDNQGYRTVEQGAAIIVKLATLDEKGPSGKFFNDDGEVPW